MENIKIKKFNSFFEPNLCNMRGMIVKMKTIITIEYLINLSILLFYYMHMFQLNSYFFNKQMRWMRKNIKKVLLKTIFILMPTILLILKNTIVNIFAIIFMAISILYNLPKAKSKIKLKFTNRVLRMFFTELILICIVLFVKYKNYTYIKLGIVNILAPVWCIVANLINFPVEYLIKKYYINEAKKILKDMPNLVVIGVTGSYGKTSMKNYLKTLLEKKYEVLATPKNYNTTMGVVKTIRENLKPIHQIFICEMGATKPNDIKEICDIVKPKYGIITSIGPQHLESFKNIENIIKTKFELAKSVEENKGMLFLNYDNEYIAKNKVQQEFITYGTNNSKLDYNGFNIKTSSSGSEFMVSNAKTKDEEFFNTKLIGGHNVNNIIGAIAVSNYLGLSLNELKLQVKKLKNVEHRLELKNNGNITIIDDSYNSNPVSSKSAIDTLSQFEGVKIIVTPGLIELGTKEKKYNFELGVYASKICDYIFLVNSKQSRDVFDGTNSCNFDNEKIFRVNSPQEAVKNIINLKINDKITILLENDLPDNYNI